MLSLLVFWVGNAPPLGKTTFEVRRMKDKKSSKTVDLRLEPEKRLCPKFDETSIAMFSVADREEMGVRVVDNCAEEHIM